MFFCGHGLALTGLYHLSILIFGSQVSKATCSNLHLALDHLITSKLFYLSQTFSNVLNILGFSRKHVVSDFWGIRAILKLLYRFFLSKKKHTDLDPTDLGLFFASLTLGFLIGLQADINIPRPPWNN